MTGTRRQDAKAPVVNVTLLVGLAAFALWLLFGFVVPVGAGWVHLLLPLALVLFIRRIVTGKEGR